MTSSWIAVRDVIPWVMPAPYLLGSDKVPRLRSELRAAGFKVFEADATDCATEQDLLESIGQALPFPDYFGRNWDAFHDSLGDLQREDFGPMALIVNGADRMLRSSTHAFVRSLYLLQASVEEVATSGVAGFQFEVFFVGEFGGGPEK